MILRKNIFLFLLITLFILPIAVSAESLAPGHYVLGDHPDGNAAEPFYGLRLDGLYTGDASDIYTFSFEADEAHMEMWIDDTSIVISGSVFGGKKSGTTWEGGGSLYNVHFVYDGWDLVSGDNDIFAQSGSGWILKDGLGQENQIDLVAYAGKHDYTFRFGDESDDMGHRGYDEGPSGWGWLNHSGWEHKSASDWLFIAHRVPEPSTLLLLSTGLLAGAAFRKRLQ